MSGTVRVGSRARDAATLADLARVPLTAADPLTGADPLVTADPTSPIVGLTVADPLTVGDPLAAVAIVVECIDLSTGERLAKAATDAAGRYLIKLAVADRARALMLQATWVGDHEVRGYLAAPVRLAAGASGTRVQDVSGGSTVAALALTLLTGVRSEFRVETGFRSFRAEQLSRLVLLQDEGLYGAAASSLDASPAFGDSVTLRDALASAVAGARTLARKDADRLEKGVSTFRDLAGVHNAHLQVVGREPAGGTPDAVVAERAEKLTPTDSSGGLAAVDGLAAKLPDRAFLSNVLVPRPATAPATPTPAPTPTQAPGATASPTPSPSPAPTATPEGALSTWELGGAVDAIAISSDGARVAAGSDGGVVQVFAVSTGQVLRTSSWPDAIRSLAFSPDGSQVLVASGKVANLLTVATGARTDVATRTEQINSVAYAPDGAHVLTGSDDKSVAMWPTAATSSTPAQSWAHTGAVKVVAFLPDGQSLFAATEDSKLIWRAITGVATAPVNVAGPLRAMAVSSDGLKVAVSLRDAGWVTVRETRDLELSSTFRAFGNFVVPSMAFVPGTDKIVVAYLLSAQLWPYRETIPVDQPLQGWVHPGPVRSVAVSPDGKRLATGCTDGKARLWRLQD